MRQGDASIPKIVHAGGYSGRGDFPIHSHENAWELVYLREGHIKELAGVDELDMAPRMFVVHPPSTSHGDLASDDYFLFHVLLTSPQPLNWPKYGYDFEGEPIGALLGLIVQEWYGGWIHRESFLKHSASLLDILMKRAGAQTEEANLALRVVCKARGIFRRDFREAVRFDDVAAQLQISRSTLYSHFHQVLGRTPQEALDDIRIRHAIYLLRHSQLPVDQVAKGSGFCSSSHLSRKLRRSHQMTPRQIRESQAAR